MFLAGADTVLILCAYYILIEESPQDGHICFLLQCAHDTAPSHFFFFFFFLAPGECDVCDSALCTTSHHGNSKDLDGVDGGLLLVTEVIGTR